MIKRRYRFFTNEDGSQVLKNVYEFRGLSSDEKPSDCGEGCVFIEMDTGIVSLFDGETWNEVE